MTASPDSVLAHHWLLTDMKLLRALPAQGWLECETTVSTQLCPRCQTPSRIRYDRRLISIRDIPLGDPGAPPITLKLWKRRYSCKTCKKPFSESLKGILPRRRTTERFRRAVRFACERYSSLKQVCADYRISFDFAYRAFYEQLELRRRMNNQYAWPESIGIDEHGVGKNHENHSRAFVSLIVNHDRKKVMEVAFGRSSGELEMRLAHIPGRENVRFVTLDMSDPYRKFVRTFFPNAQITADKFHVIRLLSPIIMKERRKIVGKNADRRARTLLLCSSKNLDYFDRQAIWKYLEQHPRLHELYRFKERLQGFYRMKGYNRAKLVLESLIFDAALSPEPEIKRLGRTLRDWSTEILNYFAYGLTNARLEGFNCKASLVRRQAYGYRNLNNYRLRILNVCS